MIRSLRIAAAWGALAVGVAAVAQEPGGSATERVPDTMEARVEACAGCHGEHGKGIGNVYFPRLAGKPAGYLYNQLLAFRDGRRKYTPMNYLLAYLPDAYLQKMAEYYAAQPLPAFTPARPTVVQAVLDRGQQLVTRGDPGRRIPPCIACHGPELAGREPGIPGLLGLRTDYISAQLGGWRYGTRTAVAPDCMQLIAARLTEADVTAVASWLSSLPASPNARPIRSGPAKLPLDCGSQRH